MESYDPYEFRKNGVMPSDASVIMGVSSNSTRNRVYRSKVGLPVEVTPSFALERREQYVGKAKAYYELFWGIETRPAAIINRQVPWLRCVVDGITDDGETVLMIKIASRKDHLLAEADVIPERYYPRAQHILLVTGAKRLDYLSFDGKKGVVVRVYPDENFLKSLLAEEALFWHKNVAAKVPPDRVKRDYKMIRGDVNLRCKLEQGDFKKEDYDGEPFRCGPFYVDETGVRRGYERGEQTKSI